MANPTISAQFLRHIANCVELTGHTPEPLLAAIGLPRGGLDDPEREIPLAAFVSFFEEAARLVANPHFGLHAGRMVGSDSLGALSFLFLSAPTLRDAFVSFTRYLDTMQQASRNAFVEGRRWGSFQYGISDESLIRRRQDAEYSLGATYTLARQFTGGALCLEEVRFEHELIGDYRRYEAYFGCEVLFSQERNSFSFDRKYLDMPGRSLSASLHPIIVDHLRRKEAAGNAPSTAERVRALIAASPLSAVPGPRALAGQLGLSVPTLGRHLRSEGTSYRALVRERQMAAAARLLREGTRPVAEIALALGFAESASFIRAFRAHFGMAPLHYRRQR